MTQNATRQKLSFACKCLTALTALGGVLISLPESNAHGYSHWSKRFLYFTAQSNLWIGGIMLLFLLYFFLDATPPKALYLCKYIFTVSITMTGLIFCGLLGPFGDPSYHLWAFSGWLTHIFSPAFAIADLFLDEGQILIRGGQVWLCVLPPLVYALFTILLEELGTDFGRGLPYPYFFMYYRSPVGLFGFANQIPFFAGTFYWLILFFLLVMGIGFFYRHALNHALQMRTADKEAQTTPLP